jgi:hypothetical protein
MTTNTLAIPRNPYCSFSRFEKAEKTYVGPLDISFSRGHTEFNVGDVGTWLNTSYKVDGMI